MKTHKMRTNTVIECAIILLTGLSIVRGQSLTEKIPLGAIFEQGTDEVQSAFKFAMLNHNLNVTSRRFELQAFVDVINTADAFKLSRLICNQFSRGVFSMLGAVSPESFDTLHSYSNTFQMPFVTPWFPEKVLTPSSGFLDFAISMRPDYHKAIIDTIRYYGWKKIMYLYDSHDGLLRLQQIYQGLRPGNESFQVETVKRIANVSNAINFLRTLETLNRFSRKFIVLDCPMEMAKEIIINHVRDISLGRRTYHYLLTSLVMDDRWEAEVSEFGAINITGFRIIDDNRRYVQEFLDGWKNLDPNTSIGAGKESISAQAALMYDAVFVLVEAFNKLLRKKPDQFRSYTMRNRMGLLLSPVTNVSNANATNNTNVNRVLDCNTSKGWVNPWEHGDKISRYLRKVEIEGLTGDIRFNEDGRRENYTLNVMEMTVDSGMVKVADWSDQFGFVSTKQHGAGDRVQARIDYERNRTYVVTAIIEEPYLMLRKGKPGKVLEGNELYEGYCRDLADLIAHKLGINYVLRTVKDGSYGSENPNEVGGWDGIVGELVRREADIAIAPLTITSERERVIDFSTPFMNHGISIMIKKPVKQNESFFSFMSPLSKEIWVCILFSYVGVSIVLYIVSRFSQSEWRPVQIKGDSSITIPPLSTTASSHVMAKMPNKFSLLNSFWFAFSSLMQQATYASPLSLSGRIVSAVWWFFTFILISSYTANFAALLTIERMTTPINSVEELAAQRSIQFGTLHGSSTMAFFKKSTIPTYSKIYEYMEKHPEVMVHSYDEGVHRVRNSNGNYALLIESPKNDYINEREPCDTIKVGQNLDSQGFGIATPLGSPLRMPINYIILSLMESGELTKLQNKWWHEQARCSANKKTTHDIYTSDGLALNNLAGIFFVLIVGLILSLFVATIEFCFKQHDPMKQHQKFKTKPATTTAMNTIQGKPKLTIQEQRDFDNGRVTYYPSNNQATHFEPDVMQINSHATLPPPPPSGHQGHQDPRIVRPSCANNTIRRIMTNSRQEMEKVLNDT
ncbi:glutamate receptor 1-like [Contarinia nasturtii]|uniref:glutamate receptor 1-like n=1 Tax=Contarinia nasturtii TaxID=265458 RepID=UPI0012D4A74C|nr:glutamate receptor 1-like [Contarinia nasturtii]